VRGRVGRNEWETRGTATRTIDRDNFDLNWAGNNTLRVAKYTTRVAQHKSLDGYDEEGVVVEERVVQHFCVFFNWISYRGDRRAERRPLFLLFVLFLSSSSSYPISYSPTTCWSGFSTLVNNALPHYRRRSLAFRLRPRYFNAQSLRFKHQTTRPSQARKWLLSHNSRCRSRLLWFVQFRVSPVRKQRRTSQLFVSFPLSLSDYCSS